MVESAPGSGLGLVGGAPVGVRLAPGAGRWGLAALVAFLVIGLVTRVSGELPRAVAGVVIALAAGVPLFLARPRFPLAYAVVAGAGVAVFNTNAHDVALFALCVLAGWCTVVGGIRAGGIYWAVGVSTYGSLWLVTDNDPGWAAWITGITFTTIAAALVRHQLVLVEKLREAQADLAERARAEERDRIGRELHDVIAHSLTVSLLHLSSARLAVEHDPADALRALVEAERLGRRSLAEVRATMGLAAGAGSAVPPGAGSAIAAPAPGLDDLQDLVEQLRGAGVPVSLTVDGNLAEIPATVGTTIYRVTQEALTNAAKHAAGAVVVVQVSAAFGRIEVSVDSAGPPGHGLGMGLANMRARAEAVGGTCTAGPGGSGWLVQASLPLGAGPGMAGR